VWDPEEQRWVEEEEYREKLLRRQVREELEKLLGEYEIELDIDLKTGKARGGFRKKGGEKQEGGGEERRGRGASQA